MDEESSGTQAKTAAEEDEQASRAIEEAAERVLRIVDDLRLLLDIRIARARVELRERVFRGLGWLLLAFFLLTLTVGTGVFLMSGLSGLARAIFPSNPWIGDLLTGGVGVLVALIVTLTIRARLRSEGLRRVREKLSRENPSAEEKP